MVTHIPSVLPINVESHRAFLAARLDWTFYPANGDACMLQAHLECELGYDVCSLPTAQTAVIIDEDMQAHYMTVPDFFIEYQRIACKLRTQAGTLTGKEALDILNGLAAVKTVEPALASQKGSNPMEEDEEELPDEEIPDEEIPETEVPDEEIPDEEIPDEEIPDEEIPEEE